MTFNEARSTLEAMAAGRCFSLFTAYTKFSNRGRRVTFQAHIEGFGITNPRSSYESALTEMECKIEGSDVPEPVSDDMFPEVAA